MAHRGRRGSPGLLTAPADQGPHEDDASHRGGTPCRAPVQFSSLARAFPNQRTERRPGSRGSCPPTSLATPILPEPAGRDNHGRLDDPSGPVPRGLGRRLLIEAAS